ncbi:MAG: hypothetical protein IIA70_06260 [Proteobacteria bacterium]|nr:hypothetical protein [Pseudomonadota bacterium]
MEFPVWVWDTAIGLLGISVMFLLVMQGTKKKGVLGHILVFTGIIAGGALLMVALDRSFLDKIF